MTKPDKKPHRYLLRFMERAGEETQHEIVNRDDVVPRIAQLKNNGAVSIEAFIDAKLETGTWVQLEGCEEWPDTGKEPRKP